MTLEAYDIINAIVTRNETNATDVMIQELTKIQNETFCPGTNISGVNVTVVETLLQTLIERINEFQEFEANVTADLNSTSSALQKNAQAAQSVADTSSGIHITDWKCLVILLPSIIVPCLLIISTILSHMKQKNIIFHRWIVYIIFPTLIFLVFIALCLCISVAAGANMNSDFCYPQEYVYNSDEDLVEMVMPTSTNRTDSSPITFNSPDLAVLQTVVTEGYDITSLEYEMFSFYVTQCKAKDLYSPIQEYVPNLVSEKK